VAGGVETVKVIIKTVQWVGSIDESADCVLTRGRAPWMRGPRYVTCVIGPRRADLRAGREGPVSMRSCGLTG
jgi:hypothetical protein